MPIDIDEIEFLPFKGEDGTTYDGKDGRDKVGAWILKRLGWQDFIDFLKLAQTVDEKNAEDVDRVAAFLVEHGLKRFEGLLKSGAPVEAGQWRQIPPDFQIQMTRELQRRNTPSVDPKTKKETLPTDHPNSSTPSEPFSAVSDPAQSKETLN